VIPDAISPSKPEEERRSNGDKRTRNGNTV
jgi:hypothetical protein